MSQHQSACIPPPSSYTPRARPPAKFRERGGRGGGGGGDGRQHRRGGHSQTGISFHKDDPHEQEDKIKVQPKDRFYRNDDDDYFARVQDEENEGDDVDNETKQRDGERDASNDDDDDDPLDAYMKSLEDDCGVEKAKDKTSRTKESPKEDLPKPETSRPSTQDATDKKGVRLDIDSVDDLEESYYKYVEQTKKKQPGPMDSDEVVDLVEYDDFGVPIGVRKVKKEIDPLPPVDHKAMTYEKFERHFYHEHDEIQKLTPEQGEELRSKLEIKVYGQSPPKPVCSFAHFKFDEQLMKIIRRSEFTQPTPIQAQAIPAILSGRNVIGIAMTGSGKTAAYLWPMIVHIKNQPELRSGDGPIGLILVPTRELALQVYNETKKFSQTYKIAVVCAYGGGSKYLQSEDLKAGAKIVVATPGRLIDLVKLGATNLKRVTYLVLDEADRFFDMGFEAQVRSICTNIRPDRQTLLFSATFKKKIEQLAMTVTENPVKIVQKSLGEANEDVTQHVVMLKEGPSKWNWLNEKLVEFTSAGSVLIFVTRILNCEELHNNLKQQGRETLLLHGDMEQSERNRVITLFRRKEKDIMIATDVAARGLDISHIRTVINFDVARDIDTHTHRIGRTGRAGTKGDAYTLITEKDREFAGHLIKNLESSSQVVSEELMRLAMQSHAFRKSRSASNQSSQKGGHRHANSSHHRGHQSDGGHRGHEMPHKRAHDHPDRREYHDNPHRDHHSRSNSSHSRHDAQGSRHHHHHHLQDRSTKRSRW